MTTKNKMKRIRSNIVDVVKFKYDVLTLETIFGGDWINYNAKPISGILHIAKEFGVNEFHMNKTKILYARYTLDDYEGSAYVLIFRDGAFWEIFAGHCSCYGLEGQWEPEKTTLYRIQNKIMNEQRAFDVYEPFKDELFLITSYLLMALHRNIETSL